MEIADLTYTTSSNSKTEIIFYDELIESQNTNVSINDNAYKAESIITKINEANNTAPKQTSSFLNQMKEISFVLKSYTQILILTEESVYNNLQDYINSIFNVST